MDMWITRKREFSHIPTAQQQQLFLTKFDGRPHARCGGLVGPCYGQARIYLKEPLRGKNMAAYVIYNRLEVTDQEALDEYRSKVGAVMANFGGRVIARDTEPRVLEGEWSGVQQLIIEFPDMDALDRWYNSDEYRPLLEMRRGATRGNVITVNGV